MKKLVWLLAAAVWFMCGQVAVADEFGNVKCWSDIPKALINQRASNERVVTTEARYPALSLKYLGAGKVSNQLVTANWLICGAEYILLVDRTGFVRDAIRFPPHSEMSPAFSSLCKLDDKELPDIFVGVLNAEVTGDQLPALAVWKIDLKDAKFVQAPTEGLRCPRRASFMPRGIAPKPAG
jgi:hypothetical protein